MKEVRDIIKYVQQMDNIKHATIAIFTKHKTIITLHIEKVIDDIMLVNADIHSCLTGSHRAITVEDAVKQITKYKKNIRTIVLNNRIYGTSLDNYDWKKRYSNINLNYILSNAD